MIFPPVFLVSTSWNSNQKVIYVWHHYYVDTYSSRCWYISYRRRTKSFISWNILYKSFSWFMFHYLKFFCSCSRQLLLVTLIFLQHQLLLLVKAIFSSIDKPWPQKRFPKEVEAAMVAPQQRKPTPNRGPCLSAPSCWGSQSQSQGSGARAVTPPAPSFATSTTTPSRNRATSAVTAIATGRAAAPSATSPSALRTDAAEPRAASPLLQPLLHRHHLQC